MPVDPTSELLILALLRQREDAWAEWKRRRQGNATPAERRLLPLVYDFLGARELRSDPWFVPARLAYIQTWRYTEGLLFRLREALTLLHRIRVETVLLKGTAIVTAFYRGHGSRPMLDFDLLVRDADVSRAVAALAEGGWKPMTRVAPRLLPRHDFTLEHPGGGECDLHRRVHPGATDALTESIFAAAVPCDVEGTPALRPTDADLLFHAIVHGVIVNGDDLQWLVDGARIVAGGGVDWAAFGARAIDGRVAHGTAAALDRLALLADVDVPRAVISGLEHAAADRPVRGPARPRQFATMVRAGGAQGAVAFVRLLEEDWGLPPWRIPAEAVRRLLRGRAVPPR